MNRALASAAISIFAALPFGALAQDAHSAHHASSTAASPQSAMTNGVVKRIDKAAGTVTIAHEPLTNLGMPAMTMSFLVKDRTWLDGLKVGAPVRFLADNVKGELTVVALEQPK